MSSDAYEDRRQSRRRVLTGLGAAAVGLLALRHTSLTPEPARVAGRGTGRIPNPTVYTHQGKAVRFYDDLIRDKVVAISMVYAQCSAACPVTMANLVRVQKMLGDRIGRDVFMYSITLFPELDTPQELKAYAEKYRVQPGWEFLTGDPADIESLRIALGFYDQDPLVDANRAQHANMVRIGNAAYNRWIMAPALVRPEQIVQTINHVDRSVVHTAYNAAIA